MYKALHFNIKLQTCYLKDNTSPSLDNNFYIKSHFVNQTLFLFLQLLHIKSSCCLSNAFSTSLINVYQILEVFLPIVDFIIEKESDTTFFILLKLYNKRKIIKVISSDWEWTLQERSLKAFLCTHMGILERIHQY